MRSGGNVGGFEREIRESGEQTLVLTPVLDSHPQWE